MRRRVGVWGKRYRRLTRRCRGGDDEAGAVLVIWVVALVGIMAFTAMAVDLGNIAQTKQRAVTAAQDAVLAGVPSLASLYSAGGGNASVQEAGAVSSAELYLEDNFAGVTAADFGSTSCAGLLPAGLYLWPGGIDPFGNPVPASDCFGFFDPSNTDKNATNPYAMAVALPPQVVDYTFGRAAGLVHQDVSAVAYASLERAIGKGGFPFSYTQGGGVGQQCIKTKSNSGNTTCAGFTTGPGNFGMILSSRYRLFPGVVSGGGNDAAMETDMILGLDHQLHIFGNPPAYTTPVCDAATAPTTVLTPPCNGSDPSTGTSYNGVSSYYWDWANYVMPQTGNSLTDLTNPLFTGAVTPPGVTCTLEPLLAHPDGPFQPQLGTPTAPCAPDNPAGGGATPNLLSADNFGSSYALNGVSIAQYLDANWQTYDSSDAGSNCASSEPSGGASTVPLDALSGSTYQWSSFDSCLSTEIQTIVQPYTTAAAGDPSLDPSLAVVPPGDQIFSKSIEQSPRFGQVPIVANSNGSNPQQIIGFADVYLDMAFESGNKVASLVAWVFPQSMIENGSVGSSIGGGSYNGGAYVPYLCSYGVAPC